MTQSDQSGQDGPARRGTGRSTSTETVDKTSSAADGSGTAKQPEPATRAPRSSSSAGGSAASASSAASPSKGSSDATRSTSQKRASGQSAGAARPAARDTPARKPRRARLRLTQVDAWTVMKTSFLLSIALGIVSVVAVAIVWTVLGAAGVFDSMNDTVQTLLGNDFRVQDYIGTGRILGFTMILAVVDVVLLTAIATLAAFLYNLAATLLGGVEVTLTEDS